jgi:hypothetical protein
VEIVLLIFNPLVSLDIDLLSLQPPARHIATVELKVSSSVYIEFMICPLIFECENPSWARIEDGISEEVGKVRVVDIGPVDANHCLCMWAVGCWLYAEIVDGIGLLGTPESLPFRFGGAAASLFDRKF